MKFPVWFENKNLSQHGIGLTLYFEYIKYTAIVFLFGCFSACLTTLLINSYEFSNVYEYCQISNVNSISNRVKEFCDIFSEFNNIAFFAKIASKNRCKYYKTNKK